MKVQRAIIPNTNINIWIVLDGNYLPVQPIQSFLRYLTNIERSPNTIRTYAYHLKLFWEFVVSRQLQWESMGVIEMADFINWLRDPLRIKELQRENLELKKQIEVAYGRIVLLESTPLK